MKQPNKLITSAGIITNPDKPRVGVISLHSVHPDLQDEILSEGIDLSFESARLELEEQGKSDEEIDDELQDVETGSVFLFGDWAKNKQGQYRINKNGKHGFALEVNFETNVACVEYSKTTKRCHHTSPCYVMADGSGPCGDLDTEGDEVLAYALPDDCLGRGEQ